MFQEEIIACVAVHTGYVMDACDRVRSKILLPCMVRTTFLLVVLTRLNVSEPEHWVTWLHSHRTGVNFLFLRRKRIQYFCLTTSFLTHFYLWCKSHLKNWKFFFAFKTFFRKLKDFCLIKPVLWREICKLLGFDG